jgi:hypothetical protein
MEENDSFRWRMLGIEQLSFTGGQRPIHVQVWVICQWYLYVSLYGLLVAPNHIRGQMTASGSVSILKDEQIKASFTFLEASTQKLDIIRTKKSFFSKRETKSSSKKVN